MTGEMCKADVTREAFPVHFSIARAVKGTVHPFDVCQGPFIQTKVGRLFIGSEGGAWGYVWNERTGESRPFAQYGPNVNRRACRAARAVLEKAKTR